MRHLLRTGLTLAAALVLAGCASAVPVPDAVGEDVGYGRGLLVGAGFAVEEAEEEQAGVPEGQILRQEPAAGTEAVPEETTVTLVVAVSPAYSLEGTFTLKDPGVGTPDNCRGDGGYDDIRQGVEVVVRDGSGSILATGSLGPGDRGAAWCVFEFRVDDIPEADFYEIEVGRRGSLTYSFDELEAAGWTVGFELG